MRSELREVFRQTIEALDIPSALEGVRHQIASGVGGRDRSRVRLVAFGKAAVPMTDWFMDAVGAGSGVVSAPGVETGRWPGLECFASGHPLPNDASMRAGAAALALARRAAARETMVYLISGGGSALLEAPLRAEIGLEDLRAMNRALVSCGAGIVEMNAVRKHVSAVKGGRLALAAAPAGQLTVYVSDVPEGHDGSVASGPTMPDHSTCDEARRVVATHGLAQSLPPVIGRLLADSALPETPKPGDPCFAASRWIRLLANRDAVLAAARLAEARGWKAVVQTSVDDVPVAEAAAQLLGELGRATRTCGDRPVCVIAGGELSSPVRGDGVGGRNQAFVLACVPLIADQRVAVMSAGTDGIDGNSPAAGAVGDGTSLARARSAGMDPRDFERRSDSYHFFKALGDDITGGPTYNNVRDIRLLVSWPG